MAAFSIAAAAAAMIVAPGITSAETGVSVAPDLGGAKVIQARVGYMRRDLGNDPAYSNYQHFDNPNASKYGKNRGFRSWTPPGHKGAGVIFFYDGGHSYTVNPGLRRGYGAPDLRGK